MKNYMKLTAVIVSFYCLSISIANAPIETMAPVSEQNIRVVETVKIRQGKDIRIFGKSSVPVGITITARNPQENLDTIFIRAYRLDQKSHRVQVRGGGPLKEFYTDQEGVKKVALLDFKQYSVYILKTQRISFNEREEPVYTDVPASEVIDVQEATADQVAVLGSMDPLRLKESWSKSDYLALAAALVAAAVLAYAGGALVKRKLGEYRERKHVLDLANQRREEKGLDLPDALVESYAWDLKALVDDFASRGIESASSVRKQALLELDVEYKQRAAKINAGPDTK